MGASFTRGLIAASLAVLPLTVSADCDDVHLFLARGNNEEYPGRQSSIAADLCDGLPLSCGYENIIFSANLTDNYCTSIYEGATNGISQLTAYAEECPDAMLVLSGYSEGANVIGDILGGGGGEIFNYCEEGTVTALTYGSSPANQIVGILLFGDPRHTAGQSYNVISGADDDGYQARDSTELAAMDNYASIMRSYCDEADPVCAEGDDIDYHLTYLELYSEDATDWVKSINGWGDSTATTTAATTSTATSTSGTSSASPTETTTASSATETSSASSTETASSLTTVKSSSSATKTTKTATATAATSTSSSTTTAIATGAAGLQPAVNAILLGMGLLAAF
ncbi:cutinase-domain-containing protein [Xylariales sp. PMI_506]|nr:cutinase-domain-containing protein [Xylariales sp. PMI_506]